MRTPQSTYRLQITEEFTLFDAAERLEALADLGVDWVYLSPILQAEPGSNHGYDVVSHTRVDAARGGAEGLDAVAEVARRLGMGVLVDIVPNHVGIATPERNSWWWQVLRDGRESPIADAFDIDWEAGGGKVLVPIVGDDDWSEDGTVGHLTLEPAADGDGAQEAGAAALRYWDTRLPVAPGTGDGSPQEVLARQHYRLGHWQQADDRLNYRRFFAVTTLAAVRVELPEVFDATHVEIERWFDERLVQGLRVDHPDGLRDPAGYLEDLDRLTGGAFVLVEKILEPGEELPRWAAAGTTGYDTLGLIDRLLTDGSSADALDALDTRLRGGEAVDWQAMTHTTKRAIADGILRAEVLRLEREVRAADAWGDGGAPADTADAIAELLACFPVYRSYLPEGLEHLGTAAERAKQHRPELADTIDALLPVLGNARQDAALRFQQTSGMVMAKGVEDTAFYRYSRLTSLNEVGGDPEVFAVDLQEFHARMARRQAEWPHAMNALSTHDTKRGEDVRARITTIAEVPSAWEELLDKLLVLAPQQGRTFANLLLQAVVGAWPASEERLVAYSVKAAREADAHTHWTAPDLTFEADLAQLIRLVIAPPPATAVEAFLAETEEGFRANVLSAKLLNLTIPGFPDVYQGSEALERSLVDPDNRRPIDWERMDALRAQAVEPLAGGWDLEVAKTRLVREALRLRRAHPERFEAYAPLLAHGDAAEHAIAFDRGGAITVATRLPIALAARGGWGDTTVQLPEGSWRELLTGRELRGGKTLLASLLETLPVALLTRDTTAE
ncbi:malto-oligosyltrehalose synthase [Agrococcus sp. ARC_14]|uniref:malto-oligosyltrehalose synthase n=1 Tax=Agrococcus sp. ARC_14 TaxID=2919927 RepID=UPI001F05BF23|nr:malto-oligosyltrehalose synthase [Agrococcus sp. ARC_14]MCH1884064.1 malto-oligosyltrehalose synthase [Agrococcus sp. ARC_14]